MSDHSSPSLPADLLFDQAACGLIVATTEGMIVNANATACGWLGHAQGELNGSRLSELLTVGGRVFLHTHCFPILQMQGSVAEVQLDLVHQDGSRVPVLMNIARKNIGGQIFDAIAFITSKDRRTYERELLKARNDAQAALEGQRRVEARLQETNEQLSRADARKDEFLATLAHELRNPLAPMRSGLELLKLKYPPVPAAEAILDVFDRQLQQMTHLVDDLMDVSRITQGQLRLRRAPVNLSDILKAAVSDVRDLDSNMIHHTILDIDEDDMVVDADATRLTQVVVNLLTNAYKYTPEGGEIYVTAARDGADIEIQVGDSGIGLDRAHLSAIFDMFSQVESALERSKGGLGIGLWLAKRIIELHGGSISASSEGPGRGSTFTIRLPAAACASAPVAEQCDPEPLVGAARVMLVDDNVDAALILSEALEALGYDVCVAHDAASALEAAQQFHPDAALLDIGLPDMNGYQLAERIRRSSWGRSVRLIALTGWSQDADKQRARDAGFDNHLTKPVELQQLRWALEAARA